MKKLIIIISTMLLCYTGMAQKITQLPVATSAVGGSLLMVRSGTTGNIISQITKDNLLSNADDYIIDTVSNVFVKLLPDSTYFTTDTTLAVVDAHRVVFCTGTGGEPMEITIPPNIFSPMTTINFVQTGTKLLKFVAGSGVTINAFPADSVHSDGKNAIVGLLFRTANKVQLYGNIGN